MYSFKSIVSFIYLSLISINYIAQCNSSLPPTNTIGFGAAIGPTGWTIQGSPDGSNVNQWGAGYSHYVNGVATVVSPPPGGGNFFTAWEGGESGSVTFTVTTTGDLTIYVGGFGTSGQTGGAPNGFTADVQDFRVDLAGGGSLYGTGTITDDGNWHPVIISNIPPGTHTFVFEPAAGSVGTENMISIAITDNNFTCGCTTPTELNIINDTTICGASITPFTLNSPNYVSYSWETLTGTVLSTTQSYSIQTPNTYVLKTIGDTANGQCNGVDTISVILNPSPVVSFTVDNACIGVPTLFNNTSSVQSPSNITSYTWDFGDGNNAFIENPNHTYVNQGTYNIKLVVETNNGCIDSLTSNTVTINPDPIADFNISDDCVNEAAQFTDNSTITSGNITNWEWIFDDGTPSDFNQNTNHFYNQDGNYQPSLIVTSGFGCKDTIQKSTTRHPVPFMDFSSISACVYNPITFINNSSINAPSNISNWIWNFGDGSPFATEENPEHQYGNSGIYNVTLIASSNLGCVSDVSFPIQVFPKPSANYTASDVCENKPPMYFIDLSSVNNGNITNWEWNFGDGNSSTFQIPSNNYNVAGNYDVELIVTTNNNCKDTIIQPVTIHPKPTADFIIDNTEGCSPVCVNFSDNSTHNATNITEWQWNLGNGNGSSISNPTNCYINPSNSDDYIYNVSLIIKNDLGCFDTIQKDNIITSWYSPLADFTVNPEEANIYEAEINTTNTSTGATSYNWDFNNGDSSSNFEPVINYRDTGTYNVQLIVSTTNNCVDTLMKPVKITPVASIFIPNSFTPNNDGKNDVFIFKQLGIDVSTSKFSIFDRWGTLIYYTENGAPWDGTYKGEPVMQDTYVYQLTCEDILGKYYEYEGHVLLLK
jgi:gliding motility-associated-like protein